MFNKEKLIEVLKVQSYSHNQWRMFAYIIRECKRIGARYEVKDGNIYVTKGLAENYPCVVAHMDTVHKIESDLTVIEIDGALTGMNKFTLTQTGIGGDDKVGVYIALSCLEKYDEIKVAFFRDEEVGCEGSYLADMNFFTDCRFVLQCDRQRNSCFVTEACSVELSSKKFQDDISYMVKAHGYFFNDNGGMTDVMALKEDGIKVSVANMSCGYYNPHCKNEYVEIEDVKNCLSLVESIIEVCTEVYPHEYVERKAYVPFNYASWDAYKKSNAKQGKAYGTTYFDDVEDMGYATSCKRIHEKPQQSMQEWLKEWDIVEDEASRMSKQPKDTYCQDCWQGEVYADTGLCHACYLWYKGQGERDASKWANSTGINSTGIDKQNRNKIVKPTRKKVIKPTKNIVPLIKKNKGIISVKKQNYLTGLGARVF